MGAADPTWPVRPPELNDAILKGGAGVLSYVASEAAWVSCGAAHHVEGGLSQVNTAVTAAQWVGIGGGSSAANATMLNTALHGLAGWVDLKPAIVSAAVASFQMAYGAMRPAFECEANRTSWQVNTDLNPLVFGMLTPVITELDLQYFGVMWPNNAAVGTNYGATLNMLGAALTIPPPASPLGASPAAPAVASEAAAQSTAEAGAGAAMRASHEAAQAASTGASPAGMEQVSSLSSAVTGPAQEAMSAVTSVPSKLGQGPSQMMSPFQSMLGMFMNPNALGGVNGPVNVPAGSAVPVSATSAAPGGAGIPGGAGSGVTPSVYTRPVGAFEAPGGRAVGLRPSGALGVEPAAAPTSRGPAGGMPIAPAHGLAQRGGGDGRSDPPTAKVV